MHTFWQTLLLYVHSIWVYKYGMLNKRIKKVNFFYKEEWEVGKQIPHYKDLKQSDNNTHHSYNPSPEFSI